MGLQGFLMKGVKSRQNKTKTKQNGAKIRKLEFWNKIFTATMMKKAHDCKLLKVNSFQP